MGNEASTTGGPKVGYHVLKVVAHSPGAQAGLPPFSTSSSLPMVKYWTEKTQDWWTPCAATWNTKSTFQSTAPKPNKCEHCAGVSTRFCSVAAANENVWHVLEVSPNSPAAEAGLESHLDYIVGTPELAFNDPEDFFTLIQNNVGVAVQLYVYNLRDDNIRLVSLRPRKDWGGVGWYEAH
ncbi:golgi family protein, putative [Acanthamoeba castellanii str. Neff]|uniref:Golgi family protein, putative n=1 Tax=Acanthamoeba castellanii (strain ATCC 30010 / Neff) TaxID=1257118 RepID=L8H559_ACACF|nr:golgi family protein, putative [Acanthamoeba castellanii str. Neff]ELR20377.1 golgi family protein, putative [Acanthamoeba castellanii str. Neff]